MRPFSPRELQKDSKRRNEVAPREGLGTGGSMDPWRFAPPARVTEPAPHLAAQNVAQHGPAWRDQAPNAGCMSGDGTPLYCVTA